MEIVKCEYNNIFKQWVINVQSNNSMYYSTDYIATYLIKITYDQFHTMIKYYGGIIKIGFILFNSERLAQQFVDEYLEPQLVMAKLRGDLNEN